MSNSHLSILLEFCKERDFKASTLKDFQRKVATELDYLYKDCKGCSTQNLSTKLKKSIEGL